MRKLPVHILVCAVSLFLILGVPFMSSATFQLLLDGETDAVSSASVILDSPSGEYYVLINGEIRSSEKLSDWVEFFSGGDIQYIFEDVTCSVSSADPSAKEMADSILSRLPENQMKVQTADSVLLLSRADAGLFDIIIMSKEYAEANGAESAFTPQVAVVEIGGES